MESYTELPELKARPNATVFALPTGALPHWERPGEVTERVREFYAHHVEAGPDTGSAGRTLSSSPEGASP